MKRFESPTADLRDLKAEAVAGLLEWSADLVLILDAQARVIDAAGHFDTVDPAELKRWRGKLWADLVTQESRGKLLALLDAAMQLEPLQRNTNRTRAKASERSPERAQRLKGLQYLMAPKTAGVTSLLAAVPNAKVITMWHAGFDGMDTFRGIVKHLARSAVRVQVKVTESSTCNSCNW